MSPINEQAAKELIETLTASLAAFRKHDLKLNALEEALKSHAPAVYEEYLGRLEKEYERDNSGMSFLRALERLRELLQK
jgi:hypothetical protein